MLLTRVLTLVLLAASATTFAAGEPKEKPANPYSARAGLARGELVQFIATMQGKPLSIRKRPGFYDAIVEAAERILAENAEDESATTAIVARFAALHFQAQQGDDEAEKKLAKLAAALAKDKREPVAGAARFHLLEERALAAGDVAAKDLAPLLDELTKFFTGRELDNRHVRMASATVAIVNRLPDAKAAAEAYKNLGGIWAKSKDAELARYGRKIEKGPKAADGAK